LTVLYGGCAAIHAHTNMAVTYIPGFAAAASTLRMATRKQLQKCRYCYVSIRQGFDSCTEWQLWRALELGAPARQSKYVRKIERLRLSVHLITGFWYHLHSTAMTSMVIMQ